MKYCTINIAKLKQLKTKREATIARWENTGLLDGLRGLDEDIWFPNRIDRPETLADAMLLVRNHRDPKRVFHVTVGKVTEEHVEGIIRKIRKLVRSHP